MVGLAPTGQALSLYPGLALGANRQRAKASGPGRMCLWAGSRGAAYRDRKARPPTIEPDAVENTEGETSGATG